MNIEIPDIAIRIILIIATAILFGIVFLAYTRVKNRKLLFISIGFGVFFIHALIYLPELFLETSLNLGENGHLLIHLIALIFILFGTFKD